MKKMLLLLTIALTALSAHADKVCDFNDAAHKQMQLVEELSAYEIQTAETLMHEASLPYNKNDDVAHNIHLLKVKLATERFVRHEYFKVVSDQMSASVSRVSTLDEFKNFHGNATKAKFYLKGTTQMFKAWVQGMMVNTATMRSLKTELRSELIEGGLKMVGSNFMPQLTDDEALILTFFTDMSVKAGMEFGGQLLAGQALRFGGSEMLLGWAGGPAGLALMVAPLFLSGTLPEETKWTDVTEKFPEMTLMPERMVETTITKDPKRALLIHCWAWERRDYFMRNRAAKIIANDQKRIKNMIKSIEMEPYYNAMAERSHSLQRDNTYVRPSVLLKIQR